MITLLLAGCQDIQHAAQKVKRAADEAKERATTPAMPCDAAVDEKAPSACLSGILQCGGTIEGTNKGGEKNYDDEFYANKFCFPAGDDRSGPERVFLFKAPANQDIELKLQSDCVDLDLVAIAWNYDGTCPTSNHLTPECEAQNHAGSDRVRLNTFKERDYIVIVEGKRGAVGTFRLSADCAPLGGR